MGLIFDNEVDQKDIDLKKAVAEKANQVNTVNTNAGNAKPNIADNFSDGKLEIKASGAYYTPSSNALPNTSTVEGQMAGLLAKESPYLQSARANAAKAANRRVAHAAARRIPRRNARNDSVVTFWNSPLSACRHHRRG